MAFSVCSWCESYRYNDIADKSAMAQYGVAHESACFVQTRLEGLDFFELEVRDRRLSDGGIQVPVDENAEIFHKGFYFFGWGWQVIVACLLR